jgi:hypothetical protein
MADLTESDKPVVMAKKALAKSLGININEIKFGTARKERIPDPPRTPKTVRAAVIRYRYFIFLEYKEEVYQYRVEDNQAYFLAQA